MKLRIAALAAAGVLGASAFAAGGIAGPDFKNKYESTTAERDCGDGDTVVYNGPLKMWPPNHKMQEVSATATDGDDGEGTPENPNNDVTLSITPVVTDAVGGDGGANHDPDYTPSEIAAMGSDGVAEVEFALRSERSGRGEGRTYTLNWVATFDGPTSKTCTSEDDGQSPFVVSVPHDMRGGADWK